MSSAQITSIVAAGIGFLGLLLTLAAGITLIVRAIRKKPKKGSVLFLVISLVLCVGGFGVFFATMADIAKDYQKDLDAQRTEGIEIAEDGSYVFRLGDFEMLDDDGERFSNGSFSDYRYTVINHWEPWCGPCKLELPDLIRLSEEYKGKGIRFVGIYTTKEDALAISEEYSISFPTVFWDSSRPCAFDLIRTSAVPATCVIDSEGRLVPLDLDPEDNAMAAGDAEDAETLAFYDCLVLGARDYDFWSIKLDALP